MTRHNGQPPILAGCDVLPPMEPDRPARKPPAADSTKKLEKRKAAGRFAVLNNFVDFTMRGLPRGPVAVWLVLYRDTKDGTARTSQTDIARRTGLSERNVRRAIRRLESLGLLFVVYCGGLNRGPSRYRIAPLTKDSLRTRTSG